MHAATVVPDPLDVYARREPRLRWECTCGEHGAWHPRAKNARLGGAAHVSRLSRGQGFGRKIEEHW